MSLPESPGLFEGQNLVPGYEFREYDFSNGSYNDAVVRLSAFTMPMFAELDDIDEVTLAAISEIYVPELLNEDHNSSYIAAFSEDKMAAVAMMWFQPESDNVTISMISTDPEHRRRGLARCLLSLCERKVELSGRSNMVLVAVNSVSERASDAGFKVDHVDAEGGVVMTKSLPK